MAEDRSLLSTENQQKIVDWVKAKKGMTPCPVCQTNSWTVAPHLTYPTIYSQKGTFPGTVSYPMVILYCKNCFYIRQFMAVPIGVVSANGPTTVEGEQNGGS